MELNKFIAEEGDRMQYIVVLANKQNMRNSYEPDTAKLEINSLDKDWK
jgi:hypothetical protein